MWSNFTRGEMKSYINQQGYRSESDMFKVAASVVILLVYIVAHRGEPLFHNSRVHFYQNPIARRAESIGRLQTSADTQPKRLIVQRC